MPANVRCFSGGMIIAESSDREEIRMYKPKNLVGGDFSAGWTFQLNRRNHHRAPVPMFTISFAIVIVPPSVLVLLTNVNFSIQRDRNFSVHARERRPSEGFSCGTPEQVYEI